MWKPSKTEPTLLWYDYETWGANPQRDRIAQFAAIRTDLDLNPVAEPINLLCQPSVDTLIDPEAVAITGLSPLRLQEQGLSEWDFAQQIERHMSLPGTCSVGYNSIRFDDECTRYLFYRNLLDPYAREWKNGNSRWDILDVLRMTKALRPEGIEWPLHEDGTPSFRLEQLTVANGLEHAQAHDAVSDVQATIALARLIKTRQPRLFSYAFSLRSKHTVREHIDLAGQRPHLHFSGKIPAREHCLGVEVPLMAHPERANEIIVIDIREDPSWILQHSPEQLRAWLYSKTDDLPAGAKRPPLKTIHLNRSPMVAPFALLDEAAEARLGLNRAALLTHQQAVAGNAAYNALALAVFSGEQTREAPQDPEHALYSGFISDHDRNLLNRMVHGKLAPERWLDNTGLFQDDRLPALVENVLARHFRPLLTDEQWDAWQHRRRQLLANPQDSASLTVGQALQKVAVLLSGEPDNQAFADTRSYLQAFARRWFPETTAPETDADTPAPETEPGTHNQMDLF